MSDTEAKGSDFDATTLGDSEFWFSPFTVPQYDLLIAQGHISQDEADRYRQEREEMGLTMAVKDLPSRPHPGFEWLWQIGGPSVTREYEAIEIDGLKFTASTLLGGGELHCHPVIPKPDDYLVWKIRKPYQPTDAKRVEWEAACKLAEGVYARCSGGTTTLGEAVAAVRAYTFEPEQVHGLDWYPNESGWLAIGSWEQAMITVKPHWDEKNKPGQYQWKVELEEGNPLRELADLLRSYESSLAGETDSRDAAILAALDAPTKAQILAARIVGDQAFEAGRVAGRRELKSAISAL